MPLKLNLCVDHVADEAVEEQVHRVAHPEERACALHDVALARAAVPSGKDEELDEEVRARDHGNELGEKQVDESDIRGSAQRYQSEKEGAEEEENEELYVSVELEDRAMTLLPQDSLSVARSIRSEVSCRRSVVPALVMHDNDIVEVSITDLRKL